MEISGTINKRLSYVHIHLSMILTTHGDSSRPLTLITIAYFRGIPFRDEPAT